MRHGVRSWVVAAALITSLSACSGRPQHSAPAGQATPPPPDARALREQNAQVHVELIRQMIDKGQFYAALAHIEDETRKNGADDQLSLLEAECRRRLGQTVEAGAIYNRLLANGSIAGEAYHGLGLLYVKSDLPKAIDYLRRAAERDPTNADVRNDLGRALMEDGRYTQAMPELSTAAELAPNKVQSRNNLIVLMMLIGNEAAAGRLALESGTTPGDLQRLRAEAQSIKAGQAARAAAPVTG